MESESDSLRPDDLLAQLGWVRALARSLVLDPDVTDDVLQEVCLLALQKAPRDARSGPRLRAWLATATWNLARHAGRAERRRAAREQAAASREALPPTSDVAEHREALRRLVDAVTGLEEPYFSAVVERYFEGLEVADIAARHGTSPAAVRQQLSRARSQLRGRLDRVLDDDRDGWLRAVLLAGPAAAPLAGVRRPIDAGRAARIDEIGRIARVGGALVAKQVGTGTLVKSLVAVAIAAALMLVTWRALGDAREEPAASSPLMGAGTELGPPATKVLADAAAPRGVQGLVAAGAPEVAAAAGPATLTVRVTWAEDGKPASDIGIKAVAWETPDPLFQPFVGRTDAHGVWRLAEAPPGSVALYVDRGGGGEVDIEAGKPSEVAIEIPAGQLVRGAVVDAERRPVSGAEIWVSEYFNGTHGCVATRADANGLFTLRSVNEAHYVGARAPYHAPSPLTMVLPGPDGVFDVTLRLGEPGATVSGHVVDAAGEPVVGANVLVGPEDGWPARLLPDHTLSDPGPPPYRLLTDAEGRFRVSDVPVVGGAVALAVRKGGHSTWTQRVEVAASRESHVEVALLPPAVVAGVVTGEDGQPLAGAEVHAGDYASMLWCLARSDAEGRYELVGVPVRQEIAVVANLDGVGKARTELTVQPGDRVDWNPVVTRGRTISAIVQDERGAPLEGFDVEAKIEGDDSSGRRWCERSGEDGRFVLLNCGDNVFEIAILGSEIPLPVVLLHDVASGTHDLPITIAPSARPTAVLGGRIVEGASPAPSATANLSLEGYNFGARLAVDPSTGEFRSPPVSPGNYRLSIGAPGFARRDVDAPALRSNEVRDLGDLTLQRPGTLLARVAAGEGTLVERAALAVHEPGAAWPIDTLASKGGLAQSQALAPGEYELIVGGEGIACARFPFLIEAGRETSLDVPLQAGVPLELRLHVPDSLAAEPWLAATIRQGEGEGEFLSRKNLGRRSGETGQVVKMSIRLLPGDYRVALTAPSLQEPRHARLHADAAATLVDLYFD